MQQINKHSNLNQKLHEGTKGSYAMMHMTINDGGNEVNKKSNIIPTSTLKSQEFDAVDPFPNRYTFNKKKNPSRKMARRKLAHSNNNSQPNVSEYTNSNIIAGVLFVLLFIYALYIGLGAMHACSTSLYLIHAPIPPGKEY